MGVILGAFGAHALKKVLDAAQLQTFETGVRYQMYHSFALIAAGLLGMYLPGKAVSQSTYLFIAGIICFSGSLYGLVLLQAQGSVGLRGLGIITPIGGLLFILGWIRLLMGVMQR